MLGAHGPNLGRAVQAQRGPAPPRAHCAHCALPRFGFDSPPRRDWWTVDGIARTAVRCIDRAGYRATGIAVKKPRLAGVMGASRLLYGLPGPAPADPTRTALGGAPRRAPRPAALQQHPSAAAARVTRVGRVTEVGRYAALRHTMAR